MQIKNGPKILLLDIETSPLAAAVWGLWENNVALNQIERDWFLLSFSAKWLGQEAIFYQDQSKVDNIEDDSKLLMKLWDFLDECDIVVGHNVRRFDLKKIFARLLLNKNLPKKYKNPPSSFKKIDTLDIAKKYFNLTSNKLEYISGKLLSKEEAKLTHKEFPGHLLWSECLKNNPKAWREMRKYNIQDVTSLEKVLNILKKWDSSINFDLYHDGDENICSCGSESFKKNGFYYTQVGKYQRYACNECGRETRDRKNLVDKEKKATLRIGTVR